MPVGSAHSGAGLLRQGDARLGGDKLILARAAPDSRAQGASEASLGTGSVASAWPTAAKGSFLKSGHGLGCPFYPGLIQTFPC